MVKEKFKITTTRVRKECDELSRMKENMLSRMEENMLTIIDQYKEKLNLAASHEQRLEDEHAKVSAP